jgi:hypothetical protein
MITRKVYENGNFILEEDEHGSLMISAKRGTLIDGKKILTLQVLSGVAVCIRLRPDVGLRGTQDDTLLEIAEK